MLKGKNLFLFLIYTSSSVLTFAGVNFFYILRSLQLWRIVAYLTASFLLFFLLISAIRLLLGRIKFFRRCDFLVLVAPMSLVFYNYSNIASALASTGVTEESQTQIWIGILLLTSIFFLLLSKKINLLPFLWVAGLMMLCIPGSQIAIEIYKVWSREPVLQGEMIYQKKFSKRPNIYFIISDQYARADQLKRYLGVDNTPFVHDLEKRGFNVASAGSANYTVTYLSISSTLDMKYVIRDGEDLKDRVGFYRKIQGDNTVVKTIRDNGYTYVHIDNDYYDGSGCSHRYEDICIQPQPEFTELDTNLLDLTPIGKMLADASKMFYARTEFPDIAATVERGIHEPYFVFAHTLSTHYPFIRNSDCSARQPDSKKDLIDEAIPGLYREQLLCANKQAIDMLDRILAKDPGAVIIFQGDHGTAFNNQFYTHVDKWTMEQQLERLSPLDAIRLPTECHNLLKNNRDLVNTFRTVFACLSREQPILLPHESFIATYEGQIDYGKVAKSLF